ncbi:MAG: zeta toxin family protein [Bacteroidales bacterium]|nr:zeta toxin family protein [Bacteroidales bacterium]
MSATIHKPLLIVIAGPNGSGKTTITHKLLRHEWLEDALYVNPDFIAQEKFGDWNSPTAIMQSIKYCEERREECLRNHRSLIFETVLSGDDKVDFIERAVAAGYFVRLFFVSTSHPSINAARITKRVMEGGHDVPITKVIKRYSKSLLNCLRVAPIVDRLYIYDNSRDGEEAQLLFRKSKGAMVKSYTDEIPEWALKLV